MSDLIGIPVPSLDQIIVGSELVFILYPVRMVTRWLDDEVRKERNHIIKHHVKTGHNTQFKHCRDGDCASLRSSPLVQGVQAEAEMSFDSQY